MTLPGTVGELLRDRAREIPNKLFWWVGDDQATFAEANIVSDRVAAGIAELGVSQGDRVAVLSTNRREYLETIFGLAKLGAIQVPLNAYLRGDFLYHQIHESGAEVVVADSAGVEAVLKIADRLPALRCIVSFDKIDDPEGGTAVISFDRVRASAAAVPDVSVSPSDPMSIMYTSGTTGMPKGCVLQHGYYLHIGKERSRLIPGGDDDVIFSAFPLFHTAGQIIVLTSALHDGLSVVIEPEFHASAVVDRWIETGATMFVAIGAMGMAMLSAPPTERDRSHRVRTGVAVPFPPAVQQEFRDRFGVEMNSALFGQTECWPVSVALPGEGEPGSHGKPAPYYEVAIVDADDRQLERGEVGEIVVRPKVPYAMFAGYWRQPEFTMNAWRNLWHHTGDAGRMGEDGSLYFIDRKKDALRRRGENIASVEVEIAIGKHPSVLEAAVFGVRSDQTEEDVMACLVLAPNEKVEPAELFAFFAGSMPYFVVPRYVRLVESLPKTAATLRVQKHELREQGVTSDTWDFDAMGFRVDREARR